MVYQIDKTFYQGANILVTGHTGFKGSWLIAALSLLGANIYGISRGITTTSSIAQRNSFRSQVYTQDIDVTNFSALTAAINQIKPKVIFHLAAQPLVLTSYEKPHETFQSNVVGTMNICEAFKNSDQCENLIVITTDKVYENQNFLWRYRENDKLGGIDPYSASKAAADIISQSYWKSFFNNNSNKKMFVVRGGNVIGGGDLSTDRLIPDFFAAMQNQNVMKVRSPYSIRPWQHVIDLILAYLYLATTDIIDDQFCLNVGPDSESDVSVLTLLTMLQTICETNVEIVNMADHRHEASLLKLDSSLAQQVYHWRPRVTLERSLRLIRDWYMTDNKDDFEFAQTQLSEFFK